MTDWRDGILKEFSPGVRPVTVVADPDGLLTEPRLVQALEQRGFEMLLFEDSISFRYAFESRYRPRLDSGQRLDLIVLHKDDAARLPYDVLARGCRLEFSLADFFPNFSYPVLKDLESQYLDQLYEAQIRFSPGVLGENATKDFVLRHVFSIAAELIRTEADLLRTLARRHYRRLTIPGPFIDRLVQILKQGGRFDGWPIAELLADRSLFFAFLQERWLRFLQQAGAEQCEEPTAAAGMPKVPGPLDLPFDNPDVRVYIDSLFLEGMLDPVTCKNSPKGWAAVGVRRDPEQDRRNRLSSLLDLAKRELPSDDSRYADWLSFARTWAEINILRTEMNLAARSAGADRLQDIQSHADASFTAWIQQHFGSLYSLPASPPIMVHHVARHLAALREGDGMPRVALVVVDGMALDQWVLIRRELARQRPNWRFDEGATFAWVPTITSVSRQSIFSGKAPLYFPSSIYGTGKEENLWEQFWADHGVPAQEVAYLKGLGEPATLERVEEACSTAKLRVLGAVVDKVDRIMHGMELGSAGMHNQVRQWAAEGFFVVLLDSLLAKGFAVFVTADHGNVESVGCGSPKEGLTADVRGERVRIYPDDVLRAAVASRFPHAIAWKPVGLPADFLPLIAPERSAFVQAGDRIVAHGGVTLEEVIVPFVRVIGGQA
jgi:hypothetical protein